MNSELRYQGKQPVYDLDEEGLVKAYGAVNLKNGGGEATGTFRLDQNALHIRGALDAQALQRRYQRKLDKHHFPPHIVSTTLINSLRWRIGLSFCASCPNRHFLLLNINNEM